MRGRFQFAWVFAGLLLACGPARAVTRYVSLQGGNVPPYTNWAMAATNIQYAVDVCSSGDVVIVTNGTYATGGRVVYGAITNRVALTNAIVLRSVNGPAATLIQGAGPLGDAAVRCVYVGSNASIQGFTLTNGCTRAAGDYDKEWSGGGALCEVPATISNCVIAGNSAANDGGGISFYQNAPVPREQVIQCLIAGNSAGGGSGGGTARAYLRNCALMENRAWAGGGAYGGALRNCTVVRNDADTGGGGTDGASLNNCIVWFNTAGTTTSNYNLGNLVAQNTCTAPAPGGLANFTNDPQLVSAYHIAAASPCAAAGSTNFASFADLDGDAWQTPPAVGCDSPVPGGLTGPVLIAISAPARTAATFATVGFLARVDGAVRSNVWDFGDGVRVTNQFMPGHQWSSTGAYDVVVRAYNLDGEFAATARMQLVSRSGTACYVATNSPAPLFPYTAWTSAARTIQEAVDAQSVYGGLVLVTNGLYRVGGRPAGAGSLTNRVVLTNGVEVRSVNGPQVTVILGQGPTYGDAAVRCAYVTAGTLSGLMLSNGFTRAAGSWADRVGAGAYARGGVLTNCVLGGNYAKDHGGGAYFGVLRNCALVGNYAGSSGGGAKQSALSSCSILANSVGTGGGGGGSSCSLADCSIVSNLAAYGGGGCEFSSLARCRIQGNTAIHVGGGTYYGAAEDCVFWGNTAYDSGGGSYNGALTNCTFCGNVAYTNGGGVFLEYINYLSLVNCILWSNTAASGPNYRLGYLNLLLTNFSYCCTTPLPTNGVGHTTNDPLAIAPGSGDFHLGPASPCIDAGQNLSSLSGSLDLDGRPRVMGGRVDMGAYEFRYEAVLKGALGGAWLTNSGLMRAGLLASNSPYAAAVATATNVPTNAVDWVLVSVRESPTGAPAAAVSAILLADGRIVGADGGSNVNVEAKGNLYGVLQHRNHLAVMSAGPVFTNRIVTFDFAGNPSGLWGGSNAVVQVSSNRWAMMAGNADGDGQVRGVDDAIRRTQTP